MTNIKKAIKYLKSHQKLERYGFVGRFLSDEKKEYDRTKERDGEGILNWCVRKALENLTD